MVLHTVNKPACLGRTLALIADGDALLLIEDGTYTAMETADNRALWEGLPESIACFALGADLAARGISDKMLPRFETVSWQQFVALAVKYDKVVSWG